MNISQQTLTRQHEFEGLARTAEKIFGIANVLDYAVMECKGLIPQEIGGAFWALEDMAREIAEDMTARAEALTHRGETDE